jgi:hypothetical protein
VSSAKVIRGTGIAGIPKAVCRDAVMAVEEVFPVAAVQRRSCICEDRDIYICLAANGWEAPLAR